MDSKVAKSLSKFTIQETNLILEEYGDDYYFGVMAKKYRSLFSIQSKLLTNDFRRSTDEIKVRLEYLRKYYFDLRYKGIVGHGKKKWPYYDYMHQRFGNFDTFKNGPTSEEAMGETSADQLTPASVVEAKLEVPARPSVVKVDSFAAPIMGFRRVVLANVTAGANIQSSVPVFKVPQTVAVVAKSGANIQSSAHVFKAPQTVTAGANIQSSIPVFKAPQKVTVISIGGSNIQSSSVPVFKAPQAAGISVPQAITVSAPQPVGFSVPQAITVSAAQTAGMNDASGQLNGMVLKNASEDEIKAAVQAASDFQSSIITFLKRMIVLQTAQKETMAQRMELDKKMLEILTKDYNEKKKAKKEE